MLRNCTYIATREHAKQSTNYGIDYISSSVNHSDDKNGICEYIKIAAMDGVSKSIDFNVIPRNETVI